MHPPLPPIPPPPPYHHLPVLLCAVKIFSTDCVMGSSITLQDLIPAIKKIPYLLD
jgi:hypothetical protein